LGLVAVFAALTVFRGVAEARLVGRYLGLHPLAVLAAVYIGMRVLGPGGLLLGPLLLVLLRALGHTLALPGGGLMIERGIM
jgi:predicted PurR-regulated permease PerM